MAAELAALLLSAPVLLFPPRFGPLALAAALFILASPRVAMLLRYRRLAPRTPLDAPVLIIAVMAGVGTAISVDWSLTQHKLFGLVFSLASYYATVHIAVRMGSAGTAFTGVLLVVQGVAIAALALVGTSWNFYKVPWLAPIYSRLPQLIPEVQASTRTLPGLDANQLGGVLVLLWPLTIALASGRWRPRAIRLLCVVPSVLVGFVLLLTLSRSTYMGALAAVAVICLLRAPVLTGAVALLGLLTGAAGIVWIGPARALALLLELDTPDITTAAAAGREGRMEIWWRAIYMMQDFPYTGVGLNTFPIVGDLLYPYIFHGPDVRMVHAHNLFLQTGVDLGLPGLIAFLWIVGVAMRCWWRAWSAARESHAAAPPLIRARAIIHARPLLAGLLAGLVAHLVYGLTDAVTLGAKPGYLLWVILAALVVAPSVSDAQAVALEPGSRGG